MDIDINLVKEAIRTEQQKNGKAWLTLSELAQICSTEYQLTITKEWLTSHPEFREFRVYRTANPLDIYIDLVETIDTLYSSKIGCQKREKSSLFQSTYSQKLEAESETRDPDIMSKSETRDPDIMSNKVRQIPSIQSCEDLERFLCKLLKDLGGNSPLHFIEISVLTKQFYKMYGKPIKSVLNDLISGIKLVEFMQCYNSFVLIKVNGNWTITLQD